MPSPYTPLKKSCRGPATLIFPLATIAVPGTYATRQKFGLDGTTSRIFLKAIANSKKLGRVTLYFSTDFRGGGTNSYTPRIRSAYVSFKGFTFGRDVTTFCDLNAAPNDRLPGSQCL